MKIKVYEENERLVVESPYHPDFPARARNLGGRWDARQELWTFDSRDSARVRGLLMETYGTDGATPAVRVTVQHRIAYGEHRKSELWLAGRRILWRPERDSAARLGEGVVVVEGKLASSGGSRRAPQIGLESVDSVLEIRDVPAVLVETDENTWIVDDECDESGAVVASPLAAFSDEDILAEIVRRGLVDAVAALAEAV